MDTETKKLLLNEAIRIGDELRSQAITEYDGITWYTLDYQGDKTIGKKKNEGIYSGTAGILLFFLELYKATQYKRFLDTATQAANWIITYCKKNPTSYYAFFTGRMGAAYAMLKMAETTNNLSYHQHALEIAKNCDQYIISNPIDDLINGTSGALLGLLHLHQATQAPSILKHIDLFTEHLISKAHITENGLYWDRSQQNIRGLCGFSHGASGIGFVFLELAYYFKNPNFNKIAALAFQYEDSFFSDQEKNWPDFRKGVYDEESFQKQKTHYLNKDKTFFTQPSFMSAWCHGAPGIGLARLRAYQLLQDKKYLKDVQNALKNTEKTTPIQENLPITETVCHGRGGNAMLFLEAYKLLKDEKFHIFSIEISKIAIKNKQNGNIYLSGLTFNTTLEDSSLFMGNAGIGYFYLQTLSPLQTPSIIAPIIRKQIERIPKNYTNITLNEQDIKTKLLKTAYPRTIHFIEKSAPKTLKKVISNATNHTLESSFIKLLSNEKAINNTEINDKIHDILSLEQQAQVLKKKSFSDAYLHLHNLLSIEKAQIYDTNEKIRPLTLKINENIAIHTTKYNWDKTQSHLPSSSQSEENHVLLKDLPSGIQEFNINDITHFIISSFKSPASVHDAITQTKNIFEVSTKQEEKMVEETVIKQVKQALQAGILVIE